jgi:hypothetical protein
MKCCDIQLNQLIVILKVANISQNSMDQERKKLDLLEVLGIFVNLHFFIVMFSLLAIFSARHLANLLFCQPVASSTFHLSACFSMV